MPFILDLLVHLHPVVDLLHLGPLRVQVLIPKAIRPAIHLAAPQILHVQAGQGRDPDLAHVLALVPALDHVQLAQIPVHRHLDHRQERDAIKLVLQ
jgi:hypothetical protein